MANWKNKIKNIDTDLLSVGTLFVSGKIGRMYDISELFPTKISKLLGINSERYSVKLSNPEKFTLSEILRFCYILDIDPILVVNVIQQEAESRLIAKSSQYLRK